MREFYKNVSRCFGAGKLAKSLKRHSQKLRAVAVAMAMMVVSCSLWAQAEVGDTLWYETWTGGDAGTTPSAYNFSGTTVYGNATLGYDQSITNTKLYNEILAGGEAPELLLAKANGTWTISNIPTGGATEMKLEFISNKSTFSLASSTNGITIDGSAKEWTIEAESDVTSFELVLTNTSSSSHAFLYSSAVI